MDDYAVHREIRVSLYVRLSLVKVSALNEAVVNLKRSKDNKYFLGNDF